MERERLRAEYRGRINRVMDYIETHLHRDLTLDELASVAAFSKYHFHRIFYSETGETLFRFLQRVRIEKAAALLKAERDLSVTEVALRVGFSNPAAFSRAFRERFGLSASQWRRGADSNLGKAEGNTGKDSIAPSGYPPDDREEAGGGLCLEGVAVVAMDPAEVIYLRHTGPFQGDEALFERLFRELYQWAGARNLLGFPDRRDLVFYHDIPDLTADGKLRISVATTVPAGTGGSGKIGTMTVAGGSYAAARFRLFPDEYRSAWDWVFRSWFPQSGYQPDDRLSFELYRPEDVLDAAGRCSVTIYIPVKPL